MSVGYGAPLPTAKLPPSSSQPTPELQHLFPGMALTLFLFLIFCILCCFDISKPFGLGDSPPRASQAVPMAQGPGRVVPHPAGHPPRPTCPLSAGHPGGGGPLPASLQGPVPSPGGSLCVPNPTGVSILVHLRLSPPPPASCFLQKRQEGPGLGALSLLTPQRSPRGPALLPLRPGGIIDLVAQAAPVSRLVPFLGTSDGPRALPSVSSQPRTFSGSQGLF